jgi:DNA-binding NarL/FixJ family response regulator
MGGERSLLDLLVTSQLQVVHLVHKGLTNKEAAKRLGMTPASLKVKLSRIYSKLGLVGPRPRLTLILWYLASKEVAWEAAAPLTDKPRTIEP